MFFHLPEKSQRHVPFLNRGECEEENKRETTAAVLKYGPIWDGKPDAHAAPCTWPELSDTTGTSTSTWFKNVHTKRQRAQQVSVRQQTALGQREIVALTPPITGANSCCNPLRLLASGTESSEREKGGETRG